jgi:hypothetical protein
MNWIAGLSPQAGRAPELPQLGVQPRSLARRPALASQSLCVAPTAGDQVHRCAVAVRVVTRLARRGYSEAVPLQNPEDVVEDARVHGLRGTAAGHGRRRQRAIRGG